MPESLSCVVVNPGTHPEPHHLAAGLAARGHSVHYFTGSQFPTFSSSTRILKLLPRSLADSVSARRLPLSRIQRVHVSGFLSEILFTALRGRNKEFASRFMRRRSNDVANSAARFIRRRAASGAPVDVVIVQQTVGAAAFRADSSALKILMQPIVGHSWLVSELQAEKHRNPDWAFALQGMDRPAEQVHAMQDELRAADSAIAGSQLVADSMVDFDGPVIVQHYGVDISSELTTSVRDLAPNERLRVLFAGQVNQRKGVSYLLTAAEEIGSPIDVRLVGPIDAAVRARISDRNLTNVTVVGPLSKRALFAEYGAAHLLVLPSLGEGFALVVPEALASGLPCVVTDRTGSHEIVQDGHNGKIVDASSSSAIVEALRMFLIDRDAVRRMSTQARSSVAQLSWQSFADGAARQIEDLHGSR